MTSPSIKNGFGTEIVFRSFMDCVPDSVKDEVQEMVNQDYYDGLLYSDTEGHLTWWGDDADDLSELYPHLAAYLKLYDVGDCLIQYDFT